MHQHADQLPQIVIGKTEELRLTALATMSLNGQREKFARALLAELERAEVIGDSLVPPETIQMDSRVEFEIDGRERRNVQLVYPGQANIDQGRISILTPIGTALLGLSPGQSIMHEGPDGRVHTLRVISVSQPVAAVA
jgi:regulator of nucleoside diphosphate kinase